MFSALFFGFLFRVLGLFELSAWGDEVASFYYPFHLKDIFFYESHTPFYYLLNRLWLSVYSDGVNSLRVFSITLNFLLTCTSIFLFKKYRPTWSVVFLFVLWWLWPTSIIFSRQARHYQLFSDLTLLILIFWPLKDHFHRAFKWFLLAIYQLIHPLGAIPVFFLIAWDWRKKKDILSLTTFIPVVLYYISRLIVRGKDNVMSNISWIATPFTHFYESLFAMFGGDSFPFTNFFPISPWLSLDLLLLVALIFMPKRNEKMLKALMLFLVTFVFIEGLNLFGINLRINRYFVYLVPFVLLSFLEMREKYLTARLGILVSILVAWNAFILKPWQRYEWDDDNVRSFKSYMEGMPPKVLVVCTKRFQMEYYFNRPYAECEHEASLLHNIKQDFYLFDLSGNHKYIPVYILENARLEHHQKFNQAVFYSFVYPKGDPK